MEPCSQHTPQAVSVDMLYNLIGEPRGLPPKATLKPEQAVRVKQLHTQQLQEAAAAEAATVGVWQQLPHQRVASQAACDRVTESTTAVAASPNLLTEQQDRLRLPSDAAEYMDQADTGPTGCGDDSTAAAVPVSRSHPVQQPGTDPGLPQQTGCRTRQQEQWRLSEQQEQLQGQGSVRTPLMHHAAIMHFASVKAAAAATTK